MKVRPLTGQVFIEVQPPDQQSPGGVDLPQNSSVSAEIVQESHANPEKPSANNIGKVIAIGKWPKLRNGMALMPEFGVGSKVLFNPWRGTKMQRGIGEQYRMVRNEDVLAVLS